MKLGLLARRSFTTLFKSLNINHYSLWTLPVTGVRYWLYLAHVRDRTLLPSFLMPHKHKPPVWSRNRFFAPLWFKECIASIGYWGWWHLSMTENSAWKTTSLTQLCGGQSSLEKQISHESKMLPLQRETLSLHNKMFLDLHVRRQMMEQHQMQIERERRTSGSAGKESTQHTWPLLVTKKRTFC